MESEETKAPNGRPEPDPPADGASSDPAVPDGSDVIAVVQYKRAQREMSSSILDRPLSEEMREPLAIEQDYAAEGSYTTSYSQSYSSEIKEVQAPDDKVEELKAKKLTGLSPEEAEKLNKGPAPRAWKMNSLYKEAEQDWFVPVEPRRNVGSRVKLYAYISNTVYCLLMVFILSVGIEVLGSSMKVLAATSMDSLVSFAEESQLSGLAVGVATTALIGDSWTTISLTLDLLRAGSINLKAAVPIMMGANIGTCVVSTMVSLCHVGHPVEFNRAFRAAVMHDIFNVVTVAVIFPFEFFFNLFTWFAHWMAEPWYPFRPGVFEGMVTKIIRTASWAIIGADDDKIRQVVDGENPARMGRFIDQGMFGYMNDTPAALIGVCIAFVGMAFALFAISSLMRFMVKQSVGRDLRNWVYDSCEYSYAVNMALGFACSALLWESLATSVVVTPVAIRLLSIDQIFPFLVGANVGGTFKSIMMATQGGNPDEIDGAVAYFFLNMFGAFLIYPLKEVRKIPMFVGKLMGNEVQANWYMSIVYILFVFHFLPHITLLAAMVSPWFSHSFFLVMASCIFGYFYFYYEEPVLREFREAQTWKEVIELEEEDVSVSEVLDIADKEDMFSLQEMMMTRHFLMDTADVPRDLATREVIKIILRNRAKNQNRGRYTIGGYTTEAFDDMRSVEIVQHCRTLVNEYRPRAVELVNSLDIYQIPSFDLMNEPMAVLYDFVFDMKDQFESTGKEEQEEKKEADEDEDYIDNSTSVGLQHEADARITFVEYSHFDRVRDDRVMDMNEFFKALMRMEEMVDLDIKHNMAINEEVVVAFSSRGYHGNLEDHMMDEESWVGFIKSQVYQREQHKLDPFGVPYKFTLLEGQLSGLFAVIVIYAFYFLVIIAQCLLPFFVLVEFWQGKSRGEGEFMDVLMDPQRSNFEALCTDQYSMEFKFGATAIFCFLILLTDVATSVDGIEQHGGDEQTPISDNMDSNYHIMKHSYMTSDPFFYRLGDYLDLLCYALVVGATYLMMVSSGRIADVLKDIIAVNFLVQLDKLTCDMIMTEKRRKRLEAKLVLFYLMYGERKEYEVLKRAEMDATPGAWTFKVGLEYILDTFLKPVILVLYYTLSFTPLLVYICF